MLKDCNIAFFIDVDNVGLKSENYFNVTEQLKAMGRIISGKIYGAGERKHKDIYADAQLLGYKIERPMRVKRRGRKEFDPRIFVDVVDAVVRTPAIDAVCIIAQPTDLVYLYSYLRSRGVKVIALDNADDASCAFIDEVIDLGIVLELQLPNAKPQPDKVPEHEVQPQSAATDRHSASDDGLDRTDELLREIERLREVVTVPETESSARQYTEQSAAERADEQPALSDQPDDQPEETAPSVEQSVEQPAQQTENQNASIMDETRSLLERIAEIQGGAPEQQAEQNTAPEQPAQPPVEQEQPALQPVNAQQPNAPAQPAEGSRAPYSATNDGDLIRRIEEIRKNSQGGDEDFIEEIRKLLDSID